MARKERIQMLFEKKKEPKGKLKRKESVNRYVK